MTLTAFPNGITSMGVPIMGGNAGGTRAGFVAYNKVYFVDSNTGSDGNSGLSVSQPFSTIQKAYDTAVTNDSIVVMPGNYSETVTTKQTGNSGDNITLMGVAKTQGNQVSWTPSSDGIMLFLRSRGHRASGIRFAISSGNPALKIEQAQAAATADTNWAPDWQVDNCMFWLCADSIQLLSAGQGQLLGNIFKQGTGKDVDMPSGQWAIPGDLVIKDNWFHGTKAIEGNTAGINESLVTGNYVHDSKAKTLSVGIKLSGGNGNLVTGNFLDGTYTSGGLYTNGTNDVWDGNRVNDTGTGIDDTTKITNGLPGQ